LFHFSQKLFEICFDYRNSGGKVGIFQVPSLLAERTKRIKMMLVLSLCILCIIGRLVSGSHAPFLYRGIGNVSVSERVKDSVMFVTSNPVTVSSLHSDTGDVQWITPLQKKGIIISFHFDERISIFVSRTPDGEYFADGLLTQSGVLLWQVALPLTNAAVTEPSISFARNLQLVLINHVDTVFAVENILTTTPFVTKVDFPRLQCSSFQSVSSDSVSKFFETAYCISTESAKILGVFYQSDSKQVFVQDMDELPLLQFHKRGNDVIVELKMHHKVIFDLRFGPTDNVFSHEYFFIKVDGRLVPVLFLQGDTEDCVYFGHQENREWKISDECVSKSPQGPSLRLSKRKNSQVYFGRMSAFRVTSDRKNANFEIQPGKRNSFFTAYDILVPKQLFFDQFEVSDISGKDSKTMDILITFKNGITVFATVTEKVEVPTISIRWVRNDGLGRIVQAKVVTTPHNSTIETKEEENVIVISFSTVSKLSNLCRFR
jgi:hypothetical protein